MKRYLLGIGSVVLCFSFVALGANQLTTKSPPALDNSAVSAGVASICDSDPANLVANCGFETGVFPPAPEWAAYGDLSATGVSGPPVNHSGNFGAFLGPVGDLGYFEQFLTGTTAGTAYTLSFWLRNQGAPNHFQVYWDGVLIFDQLNLPDFDYMPMSFDVTASQNGTDLTFGFYNLPSYFWLDDIKVVPAAN